MKQASIVLVLTIIVKSNLILASTTILVGKEATVDNSIIMARNEDRNVFQAKHFTIHPHKENNQTKFVSQQNKFSYPMPKRKLKFITLSDYNTKGKSMGAAGINELGISISVQPILNSEQTLNADPYITDTGIARDAIVHILLSRSYTALQAVTFLGKIIENKGAAEGFGVSIGDPKELWYLEVASGHHWGAVKVPDGTYFVAVNENRIKKINLNDSQNFQASNGIEAFTRKYNLINKDDNQNFYSSFHQSNALSAVKNLPRIWAVYNHFNPENKYTIETIRKAPMFSKANKLISVQDVASILRSHYKNSPNDVYSNHFNPELSKVYTPISTFNTQESHIIQIRPDMPPEIGNVMYIAIGMASLSVYLPYYQGIEKVPLGFNRGKNTFNNNSVYWLFRKLQTLAMYDYDNFSPIIQKYYSKFELQTLEKQEMMELKYLDAYKKDSIKAREILQKFQDSTHLEALQLTEKLINHLFTLITVKIDRKYQSFNKVSKL